jgi:predicted permease
MGEPEQVAAVRVSWNFFDALGVRPAAGRWFTADEDRPGSNNVVVISHALCERRLGNDAQAIGRTMTLNGKPYAIVAVLPAGFQFDYAGPPDIVTPRVFDLSILSPQQLNGGSGFLYALARLRPGVTMTLAQAEMDALGAQYRRGHAGFPDADPGLTARLANLRDAMVSGVRTAVWILFGAVSLVLLIACANVASLLLSRALGRNREIAVRIAIGATRAGIVRQLLTESILLAAAGALGVCLSSWGTKALAAMAAAALPRAQEIRTDASVLVFTAVVSVLAGVLFGLAPAIQISRPDVNSTLRAEGRGSTGGKRRNVLRGLLALSQVALSVVLVIGAGLLVKNFRQLRESYPGFDARNLLTMNIALPPTRYAPAAQGDFFRELLRRVRALPGVVAAAGDTALPLNQTRFTPALPEGQPESPLAARPIFPIEMVTPGYVQAMRAPLGRGREFTDRDGAGAPFVIMINETMARRYWPGQDPVGKHILLGRMTRCRRLWA